MYDITKIISARKGKRGEHRVFRLAENLCMNLILSLRDFFTVKREGKVGTVVYKLILFFLGVGGRICFPLLNSTNKHFFFLKGPTEFTETLNRITIITLAITIKTRGIADADHLLYLQTMLEQIMATSQHTWSEKTLRYFPSVLRDALVGRMDKRSLAIQQWQQVHYFLVIFGFLICIFSSCFAF
jgi:mediator of RNA polymerase II transcription subunit 23